MWVHLPDDTVCGSVAQRERAACDRGSGGMPLDVTLVKRLTRALSVLDDRGNTGPRLVDDALRLWNRVQYLLSMQLIPATSDRDALELACYALGLPFAFEKSTRYRQPMRTRLKDRAIRSIDLLPNHFDAPGADAQLLTRTLALLEQMPEKSPKSTEARLLADAVNLDDFGVSGLIVQALQLARQGEGLNQLIDGAEKRELYGYWDARLKDGFHFEPVRRIAEARLEHARVATRLLTQEFNDEQTPSNPGTSAVD
jgi:hypothetical protein